MVELCKGFLSSQRKEEEPFGEFKQRFNTMAHLILEDLRPPKEVIFAASFNAFTGKLAFDARNKKAIDLFQAQNITFDLD